MDDHERQLRMQLVFWKSRSEELLQKPLSEFTAEELDFLAKVQPQQFRLNRETRRRLKLR
jgi:hypothetical protein